MGSSPETDDTYTRYLSQEIDTAFEAYAAQVSRGEARLYQALLAQARNIIGYRLRVQDSAHEQDIASRAFLSLHAFRGESRVSTWFYRLAQNEVNDLLRRRILDERRLIPIDTDDESSPLNYLEDKRVNLSASIELEQLVRDLSPEQAQVFGMLEEGNSLEEIAVKLGAPLGTIRSRYRLAKEKAKKKSRLE